MLYKYVDIHSYLCYPSLPQDGDHDILKLHMNCADPSGGRLRLTRKANARNLAFGMVDIGRNSC